MPLLRPLRDYDEKDVINLYTFSGQANEDTIVNRGTLVKVVGQGWRPDVEPVETIGNYGPFTDTITNVQALRYGTSAKVTYCGTGDYPIGLTLFDVREKDENGIPLKYNPRKAAELEACISGQTVPIVTRGIFLYQGVVGTVTPGAPLYAGANGTIVTGAPGRQIGIALGVTGVDGSCLIKLDL